MRKGQIAVIDRIDLDAVSAEALAAREPAAVVNASPTLSGRFEARGAERLVARGIPLFETDDRRAIAIADGSGLTILRDEDGDGATLTANEDEIPLRRLTEDSVRALLDRAHEGAALRLPELAAGALDLVHRDGPALVDGGAVRGLELDLTGKDVLVVTAAAGFERELRALRTVARELKMPVISTGDAADSVAAHHHINLIVGPFDGVADEVLARADRVVVHGESHAVAATRLGALGVRYVSSESRLDSADLAVAIAASSGARTIATVGLETSLGDLIDSPRGASALLARVAAGPAWIDGRLLARLYRSRWSRTQGWILTGVAVLAVGAALALHPAVRDAAQWLVERL